MTFEDFQSNEYEDPNPNVDVVPEEPSNVEPEVLAPRQPKVAKKKVRLLLDIRTELTDKELRDAKTNYLQEQARLRNALQQERLNKEIAEKAHNLIFEPPPISERFHLWAMLTDADLVV